MAKTLTALLACSFALTVQAQALRDPTQPPPAFLDDSARSTADALAGERPALTTIVRRHGAKPLAVINGEMVRQGGKIGDWVVVRISESEVVLRGENGRELLTLSPDVDKRNKVVDSSKRR